MTDLDPLGSTDRERSATVLAVLRRLAVIRAARERDRTRHYSIVHPFPSRSHDHPDPSDV